ncbi:MAG: hypothetical protein IT210_19250 [Armatimonadetes bacterium]|nr:hypothetical protein [Armatimonadota bacterium]
MSTSTVVVLIVVIIAVAAIYYIGFRSKSGGGAPFAGKGLPTMKMKAEASGDTTVLAGQITPAAPTGQ